MAVIYPHFLSTTLDAHDRIQTGIAYPFFDPACVRYEALRSVQLEGLEMATAIENYGLSEYGYRKALSAFSHYGVAGLIGLDSDRLTEELSVAAERMVFVFKEARPWIPATKMRIILQGFNYDIPVGLMRHLYASYGWARGTKEYQKVDFRSLNLKVMHLCELQTRTIVRRSFMHEADNLQSLLEVFRTLDIRGGHQPLFRLSGFLWTPQGEFPFLGSVRAGRSSATGISELKSGLRRGRSTHPVEDPTSGPWAGSLPEDSAIKRNRCGSHVCDEDIHQMESQ